MKKKIYNYTAVFERNENKGYTVTIPSLPGLVTEGKNLDDARKMATEAVQCYLEGVRKDNKKAPVEGEVASVRLSVAF